jgi:hypothetical protein
MHLGKRFCPTQLEAVAKKAGFELAGGALRLRREPRGHLFRYHE